MQASLPCGSFCKAGSDVFCRVGIWKFWCVWCPRVPWCARMLEFAPAGSWHSRLGMVVHVLGFPFVPVAFLNMATTSLAAEAGSSLQLHALLRRILSPKSAF